MNRIEADSNTTALLTADQTWAYARKSTAGEGASKSLEDQHEVNLETAAEYGLPLKPRNLLSERAGLGGNLYWEGYQGTGLLDETGKKKRTRPELTRLVRGVQEGTVRCIVVYSCERLWRNVSLCHALIDLFAEKGCRLFDRTGEVNITSPEGRQAVLNAAVAAQHMREKTAADVARGWRKNREKNKRVVSANVLGFRNAPRLPGTRGNVIHVPEEQELVRRIFRLFDQGEDGAEPMSMVSIAKLLAEEGALLRSDKSRRHGNKRQEGKENVVYVHAVKQILTDVRYQGRQRHGGVESACPVFLQPDSLPVVPTALWERVQRKLNDQRRGGKRTRNSPFALSGLIRCGCCGQTMMKGNSRCSVNGTLENIPVWSPNHADSWCWCDHQLPLVRIDWLDAYVDGILAPLLMAEVAERVDEGGASALWDRAAATRRQIQENKREKLELAARIGKLDDEIINLRAEALREQQVYLEEQVRAVDREIADMKQKANYLTDIGRFGGELRADVLRSLLRWVAVVPSNAPRVCSRETHYKWLPPEDAGRVLFLSSWGTLHTAYISRSQATGYKRRVCRLLPATPEQMIGTVRDLPDPARFYAGICRSYSIHKHNYAPDEIMPGFNADECEQPVATFDMA